VLVQMTTMLSDLLELVAANDAEQFFHKIQVCIYCLCSRMHVFVLACVHTRTHVFTCVGVFVYVSVCASTTCLRTSMCSHERMFVHDCVCACTHDFWCEIACARACVCKSL